MNITIKQNKNNIKRKQTITNDTHFNSLINITLKNIQYETIHEFIKDLLTINNPYDYDEYLSTYQYEEKYMQEHLHKIYNLFMQWKPCEQYKLSECRGIFLEELTLNYLKTNYESNTIYPESKIIIDNYSSHTWDVIINLDPYYKVYECKYSTFYLKRKHLDKMISLKNKLQNSKINLVIYENNTLVEYVLKKLQQNTTPEVYEENLKKINIFTLENFINLDPL